MLYNLSRPLSSDHVGSLAVAGMVYIGFGSRKWSGEHPVGSESHCADSTEPQRFGLGFCFVFFLSFFFH